MRKHSFPTGQGGGRYRPLRQNGMTEKCSRCGAVRVWNVSVQRWYYQRTIDGTTIQVKHTVECPA